MGLRVDASVRDCGRQVDQSVGMRQVNLTQVAFGKSDGRSMRLLRHFVGRGYSLLV